MRRAAAILGSAIFLVLAPGTVAVLVPFWISHWQPSPAASSPLLVIGILLIAAGGPVLLDSFARFALQGLGTPAPVLPPSRLVVTGLYRYVRNPMYVAVVSLILGQAAIFANLRLAVYGLLVWLTFHLFTVLYEEPKLRATFGGEYEGFCAAVPRWIPRFHPWRGPQAL